MLGRDAAAERFYPLDISLADGLGVVDDEAGRKRCFAIDALEDGEESVDRFVIGGVNAERPFVGREQFDNGFQFGFHHRGKVRPGLKEVFEIRRRPGEIFPGPVHAQHGVSRARLGHGQPVFIITEFLARGLGEKIVRDSHG